MDKLYICLLGFAWLNVALLTKSRTKTDNNHEALNQDNPLLRIPPVILSHSKNVTVQEGDDVTMECHVLEQRMLHIQWVKHYQINGSWEDAEGRIYINVKQDSNNSDVTHPELHTLTSVKMEDAGWYTCFVGNGFSTVWRSHWISVEPQLVSDSSGKTILSEIVLILTVANILFFTVP